MVTLSLKSQHSRGRGRRISEFNPTGSTQFYLEFQIEQPSNRARPERKWETEILKQRIWRQLYMVVFVFSV